MLTQYNYIHTSADAGYTVVRCRIHSRRNAPINDMPHLPPPEAGGDKGGDLIGRRVPTGGRFDSLPYTTSRMLSIMGRA